MPQNNTLIRFNFEAFSKDLSQQAGQIIPKDIPEADKPFIVDIIYRFCKIAGDALKNEENSKLDAQQAALVVQFIGEWTYHKSIDIIRAGIEQKLRESILQKVAFTIFDIAKKAVENNMPQEQIIMLVEEHVKKSFKKAIEDLQTKGTLNPDTVVNALNQSNIDEMAKQEAMAEMEDEISKFDDKKLIKLASFAILIQHFPSEKAQSVLAKFNKEERDILTDYLKMPNLEEKIDTKTVLQCFEEIKSTLPEAILISFDRAYKKTKRIIRKSTKERIMNILYNERQGIKDFVSAASENKIKKIPAHIANIVSKYLEEAVS